MPATACEYATTARLLRAATPILRDRGLHTDHYGYAATPTGPVDVVAALVLAHTGAQVVPDALTYAACLAHTGPDPDDLIRSHPEVMHAIRHLSVCIDGDPNPDDGTGAPDYIDHVAWWPIYRRVTDLAPPTLDDVITAMHAAADTADAIAHTASSALAAA